MKGSVNVMPDFQKRYVQWFPGHMAKTRRLIKESLNLVDGVVEIVDARIPASSSNPELGAMVKRKPKIVLLNKSDVADSAATSRWIDYYKKQGVTALAVDCRSGRGLNKFIPACKSVLADVLEKNEKKAWQVNRCALWLWVFRTRVNPLLSTEWRAKTKRLLRTEQA